MINRTKIPEPWSEGEKIPWNEPAFSERMLKEHLSQNHDAASHSFSTVKKIGQQPSAWYSTWSGLFSGNPHLCLEENFWDSVNKIATNRYFTIDASTGNVTRHAASYQAYTNQQYRLLLAECGFEDVVFYKSLGGAKGESQNDLIAIVARKK